MLEYGVESCGHDDSEGCEKGDLGLEVLQTGWRLVSEVYWDKKQELRHDDLQG